MGIYLPSTAVARHPERKLGELSLQARNTR